MDGSKSTIRGGDTGRQGATAGESAGAHGGGGRGSAHDAQPASTGAGDQHERSAKGTYGARVSWRNTEAAACCSTVEQIKWAQGVRMGSNNMQEGWKVSEVERLIGLPRRDIQRACYEGAGGAGILSPADSSWGRRLYSKDDLLTLFMVKQERDQGLSLPEIKRLFEEKEEEPGGWRRFVDDQVARMRDEFEDAAWRLASAEALRAATRDEEDDEDEKGTSAGEVGNSNAALDEVIDRILLLGVFEIMEDDEMDAANASVAASGKGVAAETPATVDARAERSAGASTTATADETGCKNTVKPAATAEGANGASGSAAATPDDLQQARQALHELWQELADLRAQGFAADAPEAQAAAARALDGCAAPAATSAAQLGRLLDAPGMELALELRHGPGAYAYIRDAVDAFAAANQEDPVAQAHANK